MELNDYRLNAYKKASNPSDEKKESEKVESVSKQIRSAGEKGKVPVIHKAVFKNVNDQIDQIFKNQKQDENTLLQAKNAAQSGIWFEKKSSPTSEDVRNATKPLTSGGLIKVNAKESPEKESIYRRVAKFLVVIGVDEAAKIMPHLSEEQTERIIPEIATIQKITDEEAQAVIEEFSALMEKARESGGVDTARSILTKAYGSKRADEILERSVKYPEGKPFDFLQDVDAERIQLLLNGESIAVQSLVLSQLEPKKAASVINKMDRETKTQIVLRLSRLNKVSPDVMEQMSKSLHEKLLTQNTENSENMDGRSILAQILKRMNSSSESQIINSLSEENPELGAELRKLLFTEEDFVNCDNRFLQEKLRSMSDQDVAVLIRGKTDAFRAKVFANISKTRGDIILEEESLSTFVLKSESERITSQFYADLRRAWERGDLRITGRDDDEVYV